MKSPHLFVYGTLLPGLAPPLIRDVVDRLEVVGPATIGGRLYHLGSYPGCVLDAECGRVIHGMALAIPDDAVLERLDWYEGFVANDAQGSLFVRGTAHATMADGRAMEVWVYVYNRDVADARLIEDGRYPGKS